MRVLLVDDHPLFLEGLRNLLPARGVDVAGTANDGLDAVQQARTLRPDLILMDLHMPGVDGFAAIRRIKAEFPAARLVVLTMSADDEDLLEAIRSGACGYLLKSDAPEAFFARLREVENGQVTLSEALAVARADGDARRGREPAPEAPETLSPREVDVLALVTQGLTYKEIGTRLFVSERTIKYHMAQIIDRLHVKDRLGAIDYARRTGLTH